MSYYIHNIFNIYTKNIISKNESETTVKQYDDYIY